MYRAANKALSAFSSITIAQHFYTTKTSLWKSMTMIEARSPWVLMLRWVEQHLGTFLFPYYIFQVDQQFCSYVFMIILSEKSTFIKTAEQQSVDFVKSNVSTAGLFVGGDRGNMMQCEGTCSASQLLISLFGRLSIAQY